MEAFTLTGLARPVVLLVPFRRLQPYLRDKNTDTPPDESLIADIGWAVRAASRRTPWQSTCLVQAITGKWMLRRRRLPGTIHFGVAKDGSEGLKAHAWLRSGKQILTGGAVREEYREISAF